MTPAFDYSRPGTLKEAVALLHAAATGGAVLAGGTDLHALIKDGVLKPTRVVDIKGLAALRGIRVRAGGGLRLGALATLEEISSHPFIRQMYPALAGAALAAGPAVVRRRGTTGGDLCHRPACWYFRGGFGLLARHEGRPLVEEGDNRHHAVLGNNGSALFVSASRLAPALVAHQARIKIVGPGGERSVEAGAFFRIPGADGEREIDLSLDELVTAVELDAEIAWDTEPGRRSAPTGGAHHQIESGPLGGPPLAAAAAVLEMDRDIIRNVRLVLGQVAPIPWQAPAAAKMLRGMPALPRAAEVAALEAVRGARGLGRNDHKIRLARVALQRALMEAAGEPAPGPAGC